MTTFMVYVHIFITFSVSVSQNAEVSNESGDVFVVSSPDAGSAVLRITSLSLNHTGPYTCRVTNSRGNDMGMTTVYGECEYFMVRLVRTSLGGDFQRLYMYIHRHHQEEYESISVSRSIIATNYH